MNKKSLTIGYLRGIPVEIDFSWFLVLALATWSLATNYFPAAYKNWPAVTYWVTGGITAILFLASVFLHEMAHSLVAERFNVLVRKIVLYIFGGASEMKTEPATAQAQFWISIAGPLTNIALGGLSALLAVPLSAIAPAQAMFQYLAYINFILGVSNLIPGFPLDGGAVLMAIVWGITQKRHWGIVAASAIGSFVAYLLTFLGVVLIFSGDLWDGVWTAFMGWFMLNASSGEMRQERLKEVLSGHRVAEAMNNNYTIIYPDTTLQCLADEHILGSSRRYFIVEKNNQLVGMATMHGLQDVPKQDWPTTTVEQVMVPLSRLVTVQSRSELYDALEEMSQDGYNQLPVVDTWQIQGMLTREDVITYMKELQTNQK